MGRCLFECINQVGDKIFDASTWDNHRIAATVGLFHDFEESATRIFPHFYKVVLAFYLNFARGEYVFLNKTHVLA